MRKIPVVIGLLVVLCFLGCKDRETFGEDSAECDQARADMLSEVFTGWIYFCDYSSVRGRATVVGGNGDLVSIHLVADSAGIVDTTVFYTMHCYLAEKVLPTIEIHHPWIKEDGYYNQDPDRIGFMMPFRDCVGRHSLYFEGQAE